MDTVPVKITPVGAKSTVEVDGQDVSGLVSRVSFDHRAGEFPRVFLELTKGTPVEAIECEAIVSVADEAPDLAVLQQAVADWLAPLDPEELERASLEAMEMDGPQRFGEAALLVLGRWARGE